MVKLLGLPDEILLLILAPLDLAGAYATLSTCTYLNKLYKSSPKLLYRIATLAREVVDNPYYVGSLSSRLAQLEKHEHAWRKLTWSRETVSVPRPHGGYFDLSGGQYILGLADGIPVLHQHQGTTRAIWSLSLSNHFRDDEHTMGDATSISQPSAWRSFDVGEDILDFGMNVSEHDLICAVTTTFFETQPSQPFFRSMHMHIIQASTGIPHPEARRPVIHIHPSYAPARPSILLEVVGDVLCLLINFMDNIAQDVIYIIDWKAGEITMELRFDPFKYTSFTFLSADVLALLCTIPFSIELAYLPADWKSSSPFDEQYKTGPIVTRTLLLPKLADGVSVAHFSCRGEPNPSVYGTRYGRALDRPFLPDSEKAIIMSRIWLRNDNAHHSESMMFVVHRDALLSLVKIKPSESNGMYRTVVEDADCERWKIPWTTWGPQMTRWFPTRDNIAVWLTVSCGSRLVLGEETDDETRSIITVYDFGINRVKKAIATARDILQVERGEKEGNIPSLRDVTTTSHWVWDMNSDDRVTGPSSMTRPAWGESRLIARSISLPDESSSFAEESVSSLPYILVRRCVEGSYQGVLMDEECLLGLKGSADDDLDSIDIFHVG